MKGFQSSHCERLQVARVLLFGGSFNPVHFGHLRLAVEAGEQHSFDSIWFLPSGTPPHRMAYTEPSEHRLGMLQLACSDHPKFSLCRLEVDSQTTNYTVETVALLQAQFPQHRFSFLTGMDVVYEHRWKDFNRLLKQLEVFLVASRPGYDFEALRQRLHPLTLAENLQELQVPLHALSSSLIRQRIQQGRSVDFWLPPRVLGYIRENGLYRGPIEGSV